jgi:hypothetical protein
MIRFTITSGKLVLDLTLFCSRDLQVYLIVLTDQVPSGDLLHPFNRTRQPFTGLDARVLEENILRAVFNKSTWKRLKVPKSTEDKFKLATELFLMYNSTPRHVCLNLSIKDRQYYDAG